jgi:hypothetical protein
LKDDPPRRKCALIVLSGLLAGMHGPACKRDANRTGDPSGLQVFLEDCSIAGWSMIQDATFVHFGVPGASQDNSGQQVLAVHVLSDGRIDLASSGHGTRVFGEWPRSAWLQTLKDRTGTFEFSRWNGNAWILDPAVAPSVVGLFPWLNHGTLRLERSGSHGTRSSVHKDTGLSAQVRVPPEMGRFDVTEAWTLPDAGVAVLTGALDEQAGYTIVAGATASVLRNSVGRSEATASTRCGWILLSQWVDGTADTPEPRARAVRVREATVEPGEDLPAEPAHFAIDPRCHEWLVSSDGGLFEKASRSAAWQRIDLPVQAQQAESTAIAALGDRVWVSVGGTLYVVHAGKAEAAEVPASVGPRRIFLLASDEQAGRLWAAAIPVNEKGGTILTTGPAPQRMRCEELARKVR